MDSNAIAAMQRAQLSHGSHHRQLCAWNVFAGTVPRRTLSLEHALELLGCDCLVWRIFRLSGDFEATTACWLGLREMAGTCVRCKELEHCDVPNVLFDGLHWNILEPRLASSVKNKVESGHIMFSFAETMISSDFPTHHQHCGIGLVSVLAFFH